MTHSMAAANAEKKTTNPKAEDSRQFLTEALFQLMETEDFKKLTVKQLVERAGVGRATFYRHYEAPEDILDDYVDGLQRRIWRDPGEREEPADHAQEISADIRNATERVFRILATEKKKLRVLKKQGLQNKISSMIYRLTLNAILGLDVMDNQYQPYFFAGASSAMVLAWIEHDMKESPSEMTDLFMRSLRGYMDVR